MSYRVGVDIGGSFTDFAAIGDDGVVRTLKVFSRPDRPGEDIRAGLQTLAATHGFAPHEIGQFTHGTTVGVNTVIQRNGARLALFTTRNFEDVLEIARFKIPEIHNLLARRPAPLISRDRVFGIDERMDAAGNVVEPVSRDSVAEAVACALQAGCHGVVVALLHAYRNPAHESEVRRIIGEIAPGMAVTCASEVWPIIREYERSITATISGYVQPRMADYLLRLEEVLAALDIAATPTITKSNGGVMSARQARRDCAQVLMSGTASGVIGASFIGEACGFERLLSLDIGGTSADVAVITSGRPAYGTGEVIGEFQVHVPSVSVTSIGHGGGSIAWLDGHGVLKVGPQSAGSTPGPACFGKGGTRPTVTDAFAAIGMLGHGEVGYGAVQIDRDAAERAVATLAAPMGLTTQQTAERIIRNAVSGMYTEVSALVSRFGIETRDFHFLAFGGAGPMMACWLARELQLRGVIVPTTPGVLSALGGLVADLKNDFLRTVYCRMDLASMPLLREAHEELRSRALEWFAAEHGRRDGQDIELICSADMRYVGQSYEIETPIQARWATDGLLEPILQAFHAEHARLFGHSDPTAPVQMIGYRLIARAPSPKPALPRLAQAGQPVRVEKTVAAWLDGALRDTHVHSRTDLLAGHRIAGPAIVTQSDCTTCIPPGMQAVVDDHGNLLIEIEPAR